MNHKKEIKYFVILLGVISILFFVLSFVNYVFVKDFSQGNGFFISGIVFAILGFVVFQFEKKRLEELNNSENNVFPLQILSIEEEDGIVTIGVSYKMDEREFILFSTYEVNNANISVILKDRIKEFNISDMNITIRSIKIFEFDIDDFLKKLNLSYTFSLLATFYSEKIN